MMTNDPLALVWQQYGLWGFLGYVMVREVWPFIREKVWPVKVAALKAERERLARLEDRTLNAEDRQVAAVEAMVKAVHEMAVAIATNNERLSTLIAGHAMHTQEMTQAITLMRERTGFEERRKSTPA